jgi:dTDP-4-dehydrorhamnose reductase
MRALLIGSRGQLGSDLISVWTDELLAYGHDDFDVCNRERAFEIIAGDKPEIVLNCAAYHRVDDIETEGELAFSVNALGAKNVADAAREAKAAVVFVSTDYVHGGDLGRPCLEDDLPRPLSVYGTSKLAGEYLVRQSNPNHYVVRSSSLFGVARASGKGGNFVETMIRKAQAGEPLRVVDDQVSSPTYTADLADKIQELVATGTYGLYQITNRGQTSWFGFAAKIFEMMDLEADLTPISSEELGAPATRPAFSVMENRALEQAGLTKLRSWEDALAAYLTAKGHIS